MTAALDDVRCNSCGEPATHRKRYTDVYVSGEIELIPFCDECDPPRKSIQLTAEQWKEMSKSGSYLDPCTAPWEPETPHYEFGSQEEEAAKSKERYSPEKPQ
jgi:hypothetical protein